MIERPEPPSRRQVIAVLVACGAIGAFLGAVWRPEWQDALEPAQVLAGLVSYPSDNPVYIYSTRTWTVLHQVPALLLSLGCSERALTLMLSGVMGMVSLQALGLIVLALSGDVPLAILSPVFILVTNTASGGVTYPVHLLGVSFTYGVLGLSYLLLAVGLMGAGQVRWGALLLGFGPAVHATIGAWGIVLVTTTIAICPRRVRQSTAAAWPYFLVGVGVAAVGAAAHYLPANSAPPAGLSAFVQHWDEHRQPFRLLSGRALATYFSAGLPILWLWRFRRDVPPPATFLLGSLAVAAVVGGTLSASYWIVPAEVPNVIPALMPSRLLNLNVMSSMALIIGLSATYRSSAVVQSALAVMVCVLIVLAAWLAPNEDPRFAMLLGWTVMVACGLLLAIVAERRRRAVALPAWPPGRLTWTRRVITGAMVAALIAVIVAATAAFSPMLRRRLADSTTDLALAAAATRSGLLLAAGDLHQIQLLTRRPVLLDGGALDALLYVPEAAAETDRILQRVYGTDLQSVRRTGVGRLAEGAAKALWEARTAEEWTDVAHEFAVADILTGADWRLQLPVVASSSDFILYAVAEHR